MKTQKAIAITMVLTSSILTGLACEDIAYPAILCMLGLLGLQRRFTWDFKPERRIITSLLLLFLTVIFVLHYRYTGSPGRMTYVQATDFAWQTIARYFFASMILILFLGPPKRLPASLGLFHVAVTISAGQNLLLEGMDLLFRLSEIFSVILVVLYAVYSRGSTERSSFKRAGHTPRWLAFSMILFIVANCGWIISSILYRHVEVLNYLPARFWRGNIRLDRATDSMSHVGFSTSGKLSSILMIKGSLDTTPVLSIKCDNRPGYLRAKAFEVYRQFDELYYQSEWSSLSNQEALFPEQSRPFGMYFVGKTNLFRINKTNNSNYNFMKIRHEFQFTNTLFTPLGTCFVEAPLNLLLGDENDIVYASNTRSNLDYGIAYMKSAYRRPPARNRRRQMLNIPTQLDRRVRELANRIFDGCNTTTEKIDAVIKHFNTNYTYSLGLEIPSGRDKLTHFLLEESTGYCEYFASGAAILLRLAGVPTRYVTGFLVTEKDPESEFWVARNMDAHAWVEAWDQEQNQWSIVEATVGEASAAMAGSEQAKDASGGAGASLSQLLQDLYQYGLVGLLGWSFKFYSLFTSSLLIIVLVGILSFILLRRHNRKSRGHLQSITNPQLVVLHRMLTRMDQRVKSQGLWRNLNETLHSFSERIRARDSGDGPWTKLSDWYLEYANLRYCRKISSKRLEQLQQFAQRLHNSLKGTSKRHESESPE